MAINSAPTAWLSGYENSKAITVSGISAGVVATSATNLAVDQPFYFSSLASITGSGLAINTIYFVKTVSAGISFTYAATVGGSAVTTGGSGAGTALRATAAAANEIVIPLAAITSLSSANAVAATGDIRQLFLHLNETLLAAYNALATANRPLKMTLTMVRKDAEVIYMPRFTVTVTAETVDAEA